MRFCSQKNISWSNNCQICHRLVKIHKLLVKIEISNNNIGTYSYFEIDYAMVKTASLVQICQLETQKKMICDLGVGTFVAWVFFII